MLADYILRGAKAGLVAGLLFGLLVALVANPLVAAADTHGHADAGTSGEHAEEGHAEEGHAEEGHAEEGHAEEGHAEEGHAEEGHADEDHAEEGHADEDHAEEGHAEAGGHHESAVSATVTNVVSVGASVLWGLLLGTVVFGVAGYVLEPIVPGEGAVQSALLAVGGFVTVSGAPWLLLPPSLPGVERAIPTDTGMVLYAGMMVAGAVVCLLSAVCYDRLRDRYGRLAAGTVAMAPFALLVAVGTLTPFGPATGSLSPALADGLLGTVVFGQLLLWTALAATHARLGGDDASRSATPSARTDAALSAD
ncbi:CbtA family protein [Halomicrobium katesii]|uniref:CbtA family protein n=1 Tax=Halomicrobium katesii TaxID=437163 RepID=UPI00037CA993|nr:CbtA family protein [Halomicrobium katesii]